MDDDVDKKSALKIELNKLRDKARDSEGEKPTNLYANEKKIGKILRAHKRTHFNVKIYKSTSAYSVWTQTKIKTEDEDEEEEEDVKPAAKINFGKR